MKGSKSNENNDYRKQLEEAKTYLMDDILTGYPDASFVDVERGLKDKGFFKEVEATDMGINEKLSHMIMWNTTNQFVIDTINELKMERRIKLEPVDVLAYQLDGRILPMQPITPEISKKVMKAGYVFADDEFYWVPTIINRRID